MNLKVKFHSSKIMLPISKNKKILQPITQDKVRKTQILHIKYLKGANRKTSCSIKKTENQNFDT
jgi:hypothetical protein